MEDKIAEEYVYINDQYRITSDGSRNLVLQNKYEKRDGKGKSAPMSGVFDYKDVGYFGANLSSAVMRFKEEEFLTTFKSIQRGQEISEALAEVKELMIQQHKELMEVIRPTVTLNLKNVKDSSSKGEEDDE